MAIPAGFQLPLLGPVGNEYADSVDMTTILGLRPQTSAERPTSSTENGSRNHNRERE